MSEDRTMLGGTPRQFEYIEVDLQGLRNRTSYDSRWGDFDYIKPCVRCGRYTEDPTTDLYGNPLPDHHFYSEEDKLAVCIRCLKEDFGAALKEDTLQLLDETLGLAETDRGAIKAFIETIFTDPKKILKVQDLDNRVVGLERQIGSVEKQISLMWTVIGGLVIVLLGVVVTLVVALIAGS